MIGLAALVLSVRLGHAFDSQSKQESARALYLVMGGNTLMQQGGEAALREKIRRNPDLAPYEDLCKEWLRSLNNTGELESEMVKLYADTFSEEEIAALLTFYRSPAGQKVLAQLPMLTRRAGEIGSRIAKEHASELEEMIEKRKKELEQKDKPKQ
jgi:hypothetical protein